MKLSLLCKSLSSGSPALSLHVHVVLLTPAGSFLVDVVRKVPVEQTLFWYWISIGRDVQGEVMNKKIG